MQFHLLFHHLFFFLIYLRYIFVIWMSVRSARTVERKGKHCTSRSKTEETGKTCFCDSNINLTRNTRPVSRIRTCSIIEPLPSDRRRTAPHRGVVFPQSSPIFLNCIKRDIPKDVSFLMTKLLQIDTMHSPVLECTAYLACSPKDNKDRKDTI